MKNLIMSILIAFSLMACERDHVVNCFDGHARNQLNTEKLLVSKKVNDEIVADYIYDSLKRLVKSNLYSDDKVYLSRQYFYNSEGMLESILSEYDYGSETENYEYDPEGRIVEVTNSMGFGNAVTRKLRYNSCRLVSIIEQGEDFSMVTKFSYDIKGNTTKVEVFLNGELFERRLYRYDEKNNPLKYQIADPFMVQNNNIISHYYYSQVMSTPPWEMISSYEYDQDNYPVKEYRISNNGRDTTVWDYIYNE